MSVHKVSIKITQASLDCIITELLNAKNAIECGANEDGADLEDPDHDSHEEWTDICNALHELGA